MQQITLYVDTRTRASEGGALVLNSAISGLVAAVDKRAESAAARDLRIDARLDALTATDEHLRAAISVVQQATLVLKREVARFSPAAVQPSVSAGAALASPTPAFSPALDAYKYLAFEDRFRGSREDIRARLESYLPFFEGASDVLDAGCGRGEFLELLGRAGITARGIDLNHEMVETCRESGLDVTEADAVSYLSSVPDESLGGLFAAQVVEHLQPGYLLAFLELAFHKLRPGSRIVLETLNPSCWVAFFESYIRDITHVWPLHPETLKYLVLASGFTRADLEYRSPVAPEDRLQAIQLPEHADARLADVAEAFNANVEKLNARLFTYRDYAVIGGR